MATDRHGGVLDLSKVEHAPLKVKLPDEQLYDMASPRALGVLPMQRLVSRYRRAEELLAKTDATPADADEMLELLLDCCQVILPDAPRDVVGRVGLPGMQRLVQAFFDASPAGKAAPAGTPAS